MKVVICLKRFIYIRIVSYLFPIVLHWVLLEKVSKQKKHHGMGKGEFYVILIAFVF